MLTKSLISDKFHYFKDVVMGLTPHKPNADAGAYHFTTRGKSGIRTEN